MKHFHLKNIFLSLCLFASISAFAAEPVEIDGICYNLSEDDATAEVTRGSYSGAVVIPESITSNGVAYSVTSIGEKAFASRKEVTSVTIPGSVASIGEYAFYGCYGLTSITIPEGVTSIGNNAFSYCKNLTSVTIPSTVTSISDYAFYSCSNLPSITIPNSVTSIGHDAFCLCRGLTSVTIPSGVTSIGSFAFYGCSSLPSVTIPEGVTSIGKDAFSYCYGMTSVTIPNSVTSIESYTFYNCTGLTSVNFPNGLTKIDDYAFGHCTSLNSFTLPSSVTNISHDAFSETSWYNDQPDGVVYLGKMAYTYKGSMENEIPVYAMRDDTIRVDLGYMIQIKEGTTTINESAFSGRTELCAVIFPKSMKTIGNSAFSGCYMLFHIDILENETGPLESIINLPDGVTTIGSYAFSNCMSISSVNIPNSVTDLGEGSFYSCIGLTEVDIPNSVTTIPSATFSGCSGLKEISIPESVDSIGPSAFSNAKPDTIYCYAQEVPRTADKAFEGLNDAAMGKIKLFVPAISVDLYKSHAIWRKFSVQALVEDPSIKEFENGNDEDGINSTYADESVTDVYDLNGRKQSTMQRGMNIIRMSDGSVRKVLVK